MIKAATIHVQIIELVTGNPKTVNTAGAAGGTPSAACPDSADAGVAGVCPAGGAADCAGAFIAKTMAMNVKTKKMI
jgi:hypothetical protein